MAAKQPLLHRVPGFSRGKVNNSVMISRKTVLYFPREKKYNIGW